MNMDTSNWIMWAIVIAIVISVYQAFTSDFSSGCDERDYECQYNQDRGDALDNPARWGR